MTKCDILKSFAGDLRVIKRGGNGGWEEECARLFTRKTRHCRFATLRHYRPWVPSRFYSVMGAKYFSSILN